MSGPMTLGDLRDAILVELDQETWRSYLDSAERWFHNVLALQSAFSGMAAGVHGKVRDASVKPLLGGIAEAARGHVGRAEALYRIIGREPPGKRRIVGTILAGLYRGWADLVGLAAGASAPWRDLVWLHALSLQSMSAFGAAEQLGYSLGLPDLAGECFEIVSAKHADHLVLRELVLEMVPRGVLYKTAF